MMHILSLLAANCSGFDSSSWGVAMGFCVRDRVSMSKRRLLKRCHFATYFGRSVRSNGTHESRVMERTSIVMTDILAIGAMFVAIFTDILFCDKPGFTIFGMFLSDCEGD